MVSKDVLSYSKAEIFKYEVDDFYATWVHFPDGGLQFCF